MTRQIDIYGGRAPRDVPLYTAKDLSRYMRIPTSTIRYWVAGRGRYRPVIERPDSKSPLLSFTNALELHVLHKIRVQHGITLPKVRVALSFVERELGITRPLIHARFYHDGIDLFLDRLGNSLPASDGGQLRLWREHFLASLQRIEFDEQEVAASFYLGIGDQFAQRRSIVIDPTIAFGNPVLRGTRIRTAILKERFVAGEDPGSIADDYGQDRELILDAIRCELSFAA